MPWKETSVMDERMKFVGRLLSGEKMAPLCREFGISRMTGHKIWNRYNEYGTTGIRDRSRTPRIHPIARPHGSRGSYLDNTMAPHSIEFWNPVIRFLKGIGELRDILLAA